MNCVGTKTELASKLGVRYATLLSWFKLPDRPSNFSRGRKRYDCDAWAAWISRRTKSPRFAGGVNGSAPSERELALTERVRTEAQRSRLRLQIELGEYLDRHTVCTQIEEAHSTTRRELAKILVHELPPRIAGLDASAIRRQMRKTVEELCDELSSKLAALTGGDNFRGGLSNTARV
jgi:predicted site-specific integrase-resolvase